MATSDLYKKDGGEGYHSGKHTETPNTVALVSEFRAKKFRHFISPLDKVLEYGVGAGWNLRKINCAEKTGYDVSTWVKPLVENDGIVFISDPALLPKQHFDIVICHHVLEHVPDPLETLKEIKEYLNVSGRLLLFVPTDTSARFNRFNPKNKDHHLFTWNVQSLCNLVIESGYSVTETTRHLYGFDRFISHSIDKYRLPAFLFRPLFYVMNLLRPDREIMLVCARSEEKDPKQNG